MCAQNIQRLIQAIILGFTMGLAGLGIAGDTVMLQLAFIIQFSMMVMLFIAGLTGFCPGLIMLKKVFPSCEDSENVKGDN